MGASPPSPLKEGRTRNVLLAPNVTKAPAWLMKGRGPSTTKVPGFAPRPTVKLFVVCNVPPDIVYVPGAPPPPISKTVPVVTMPSVWETVPTSPKPTRIEKQLLLPRVVVSVDHRDDREVGHELRKEGQSVADRQRALPQKSEDHQGSIREEAREQERSRVRIRLQHERELGQAATTIPLRFAERGKVQTGDVAVRVRADREAQPECIRS